MRCLQCTLLVDGNYNSVDGNYNSVDGNYNFVDGDLIIVKNYLQERKEGSEPSSCGGGGVGSRVHEGVRVLQAAGKF